MQYFNWTIVCLSQPQSCLEGVKFAYRIDVSIFDEKETFQKAAEQTKRFQDLEEAVTNTQWTDAWLLPVFFYK